MKKWKNLIALAIAALMVAPMLFAGGAGEKQTQPGAPAAAATDTGATPRKETLYMAGVQWGAPTNFNLLTGNPSWPVPIANNRFLIYEALFGHNMLTDAIEPLLGTSYAWADESTLKVNLNPAAKWNDGNKLTADDVVYTYELSKKYPTSWSSYWQQLDAVVAESPTLIAFKLNKERYNPLRVLDAIVDVRILPKHIWTKIEADNGNDIAQIRKFFNPKPVGSGPYMMNFYDDTRITLIRDDNYWGKVLFGKLPAPKYITHTIFKSNDAGNLALKTGEVDMSQQFIPQVWNMWKDGAPIRTYLKNLPYYVPAVMPSIWFNLNKKGLNVPEVRRAIAMCIDYAKVSEIAMSGYSAAIQPALTLPAETARYIDQDAIKPLQWKYDVEGANKLLDSIGAAKGSDGIRVLNGTRLGPWDLECPFGWTDWNASLEIVMQSALKIGIDLRTKFPESPVWMNDRNTGNFDILMHTPVSVVSPSQPWNRANFILNSKGVPAVGETAFSNFGRFKDARADEILDQIPRTKDAAQLKKLYTELTIIWLKNIPTVPLMYRPSMFYTFNESVWTGFPVEGDGTNIPPNILTDGAGIKGLYVIKNK